MKLHETANRIINEQAGEFAKAILYVLMRADFQKWHDTKFEDYVTGEESSSEEEILKRIDDMFKGAKGKH